MIKTKERQRQRRWHRFGVKINALASTNNSASTKCDRASTTPLHLNIICWGPQSEAGKATSAVFSTGDDRRNVQQYKHHIVVRMSYISQRYCSDTSPTPVDNPSCLVWPIVQCQIIISYNHTIPSRHLYPTPFPTQVPRAVGQG